MDEIVTTLNPALYETLVKLYKRVGIVNEGYTGSYEQIYDEGRYIATRAQDSEQYRINCPVCGDTRQRLYISHWAFRDLKHKSRKVVTTGLMHCHNEKCNLVEVKKQIGKSLDWGRTTTVPVGKTARAISNEDMPMPAGSIPVNDPSAPKITQDYLKKRGFDLDYLYGRWDVHAVEVLPDYADHGPKIIYPVYWNDKRVFWQARLSWDPTKEDQKRGARKYFNLPGVTKSKYLYNRDGARGQKIVIMVEGVTDVHKIGDNAIAFFGKCPSSHQLQIIANVFSMATGIILLDSDADDEVREFCIKYKEGLFQGGLYPIYLKDKDPGSYSREAIWDIISTEIATQAGGTDGIQVMAAGGTGNSIKEAVA
jgi:hypothetical protein